MTTLQQSRRNRAAALAARESTYTGAPCRKGHATRYTSNRQCVECAKAQRAAQLERMRKERESQ